MLNKDVYQLLGLAMRSRNIATGEAVLTNVRNKKAALVLVCEDASENTKKLYKNKCTHYGVEYIIKGDSDSLSYAIGKENRMAIAVLDQNFAKNIKEKRG